MRAVYKDHDRYRGQAKRLAAHIEKEFATDKIYEQFVNSIIGKSSLKPQDFNGVSFCIPTNGKRPDKTELTIKSIKAQVGKPVEIILCGDVDNFRHIEGVTLVDRKQEAHTRKVALLRNKAAEVAKYDVIAWCDDDVVVSKTWLEDTIEFSKENGWEVLGNKVLSPDGTRYWDRATLSPKHELVSYDHPNYHKGLYQSSAFFIVRKNVWNNVKWDENHLVYADREGGIPEDIKYSIDLQNKYSLCFNKNSLVWHNDEKYVQMGNITLFREAASEKFGFCPKFKPKQNFIELIDEIK
jgi:hypothetical protein